MGACLTLLVTLSARLSAGLRASRTGSMVVAGLLSGAAAYWLFAVMTVINACALGVSFPLSWEHACGH